MSADRANPRESSAVAARSPLRNDSSRFLRGYPLPFDNPASTALVSMPSAMAEFDRCDFMGASIIGTKLAMEKLQSHWLKERNNNFLNYQKNLNEFDSHLAALKSATQIMSQRKKFSTEEIEYRKQEIRKFEEISHAGESAVRLLDEAEKTICGNREYLIDYRDRKAAARESQFTEMQKKMKEIRSIKAKYDAQINSRDSEISLEAAAEEILAESMKAVAADTEFAELVAAQRLWDESERVEEVKLVKQRAAEENVKQMEFAVQELLKSVEEYFTANKNFLYGIEWNPDKFKEIHQEIQQTIELRERENAELSRQLEETIGERESSKSRNAVRQQELNAGNEELARSDEQMRILNAKIDKTPIDIDKRLEELQRRIDRFGEENDSESDERILQELQDRDREDEPMAAEWELQLKEDESRLGIQPTNAELPADLDEKCEILHSRELAIRAAEENLRLEEEKKKEQAAANKSIGEEKIQIPELEDISSTLKSIFNFNPNLIRNRASDEEINEFEFAIIKWKKIKLRYDENQLEWKRNHKILREQIHENELKLQNIIEKLKNSNQLKKKSSEKNQLKSEENELKNQILELKQQLEDRMNYHENYTKQIQRAEQEIKSILEIRNRGNSMNQQQQKSKMTPAEFLQAKLGKPMNMQSTAAKNTGISTAGVIRMGAATAGARQNPAANQFEFPSRNIRQEQQQHQEQKSRQPFHLSQYSGQPQQSKQQLQRQKLAELEERKRMQQKPKNPANSGGRRMKIEEKEVIDLTKLDNQTNN